MPLREQFLNRVLNTLRHCRDLGFASRDMVVAGSSALYLLDVLHTGPEGMPGDIDVLVVNQDRFRELFNGHGFERGNINGFHDRLVKIEGSNNEFSLDLTAHWPTHRISDTDIYRNCVECNGLLVMSPKFAFASMQQFQRDKDKSRFPLLQERVVGHGISYESYCINTMN